MIELVDPRGRVARLERRLAPRLGHVPDAARIGFLINEATRHQGPDFFGYTLLVEEVLGGRLALSDVRRECKPSLSRPADEALLDRFRDYTGVINGLAK
jgi:hypothetical protein